MTFGLGRKEDQKQVEESDRRSMEGSVRSRRSATDQRCQPESPGDSLTCTSLRSRSESPRLRAKTVSSGLVSGHLHQPGPSVALPWVPITVARPGVSHGPGLEHVSAGRPRSQPPGPSVSAAGPGRALSVSGR